MRDSIRPILIVILLAGSLGSPTYAQTPDKAQQAVLQAEHARVEAVLKADIAALEPMLANDLTYCHSSGVVDSKESLLGKIKSGALKYEVFQHRDEAVRIYGNTAVLTGTTTLRLGASAPGGTTQQFDMRFTSVYVRQSNRWRQVAWESTRLPQ